jgi:hypothetical protein
LYLSDLLLPTVGAARAFKKALARSASVYSVARPEATFYRGLPALKSAKNSMSARGADQAIWSHVNPITSELAGGAYGPRISTE